MEEVKNEEVVEEIIQEIPPVEEVAEEQKPKLDLSKFGSKDDDDVIKVDLNPTVDPNQTDLEEVIAVVEEESPIKQQDAVTEEKVIEVIEPAEAAVPENIQKLMSFMDETGGDLGDYVKLNRDISELDNQDIMLEYYKSTKPHLNSEEINFLMEDSFSFDEGLDSEKDIKRKKLALKESSQKSSRKQLVSSTDTIKSQKQHVKWLRDKKVYLMKKPDRFSMTISKVLNITSEIKDLNTTLRTWAQHGKHKATLITSSKSF